MSIQDLSSSEPHGVFPGFAIEAYHSGPGVSNTMLSAMAECPRYCYAMHIDPQRPQRPQREWMLTGPLAHCAVLEPDAMAARYVVVPEDAPRRPTRAQLNAKKPSPDSVAAMDWWAHFNDCADGREVVSAEQYSSVQSQLAAVLAVPELVALLSAGEAERSAYWTDKDTGLLCRCRPDWTHPDDDSGVTILDLKTAADVSPDGFAKSIGRLGYHRQAAFYSQGYAKASGKRVNNFIFGAVSKVYPFIAQAYILTPEDMQQGAEEVAELLSLYKQCKQSNNWPAYGDGYVQVQMPAWARRSEEIEVSYVAA